MCIRDSLESQSHGENTRSGVLRATISLIRNQQGCFRISSIKTHLRRWVNEGHDITTAEEMKIVLEFREGVRECRFSVVVIDKSTQNSQVRKIPGISFLNSLMFFDVGIRAWKTYQIGEGHCYPYSSLTTNAQGGIAVKVLVPFSLSSNCSLSLIHI